MNSNLPTHRFAKKSAIFGSIFDHARIDRELAALESKLSDPAIWSNPAESQVLMRERKRLEGQLAMLSPAPLNGSVFSQLHGAG